MLPIPATLRNVSYPLDPARSPREQWHTFWNPGEEPCRILEIIAPGGFEHYFDELAAKMASPDFEPPHLMELANRYGLQADPTSIGSLCAEHGLWHPSLDAG